MRTNDIIKIAFRNLSAGKAMVKKMVFGMTFVVMMLLCFFIVIESYDKYIIKFNREHVADRYYYTLIDKRDISDMVLDRIVNQSENERYNADETVLLCNIALKDDVILTEAGKINIYIGDTQYNAKNYYSNKNKIHQNIRGPMWPIEFSLYRKGMSIFSEAVINAYGKDYMIGAYPVNQGEIMLDSYILDVYGIKQAEEKIGSSITIYSVDEEDNWVIFENYKLTGIFKGDLLSARECSLTSDNHLEHIYVNLRNEDESRFNIQYGTIRYYFDEYTEYISNYKYMNHVIKMNIDELSDTDVNLTGYGMQYFILYWIMENIGKLLVFVAIGIGLIITASVTYIFQFYRDRNAHYIAMLNSIGMIRKNRMRILFVEVSIIVLVSSAIGMYLSVIFLLLFNMMTTQVLNFEVLFDVKAGIIALICSWIYFAVCLWITMQKNSSRYSEV